MRARDEAGNGFSAGKSDEVNVVILIPPPPRAITVWLGGTHNRSVGWTVPFA